MVRLPDSNAIPVVGLRGQRPNSRIDSTPIAQGEEAIGQAIINGGAATGEAIARGGNTLGQAQVQGGEAMGRAVTSGGAAIGNAISRGGNAIGDAESQGGQQIGNAISRGGQQLANAQQSGANAISASVQNLGRGVENIGSSLADLKTASDRLDYARAQSEFRTKKIELDQEFADDQDYATLQDRYSKRLNEIQQTTAQMIGNDAMREQFSLSTNPIVAQGVSNASQTAFSGLKSNKTTDAVQKLDDLANAALRTSNPNERAGLVNTANSLITSLQDGGFITPAKAQELRQNWTEKYAKSQIAILPAEQQINMLREAPTSRDAILDRIGGIENSGGNPAAKNPNSSATGDFQFIDSTWLKTIKQYRPDIAQGHTDEQLLDLRKDPKLSREMAGYLMDDNAKVLRSEGVVPTPTTLYLAHFLGAQGAADVMNAKKGTPVDDVLEENEIESNRRVLAGKTTDAVIAWAQQKMGGATRGRGDAIDFIPEVDRVNLLNSATASYLNQQRQQDSEYAIAQDNVKAKVADDVHKMLAFGQGDDTLTPDLVRSVYGAKGVQDWQDQRNDAQAIWLNSHDLSTMTDTAITQRLASITPKQGDQDFARKQVIYKAVADQAAAIQKQRVADPAASVSDDPIVKRAAAELDGSPEATQALATARIVAQKRAGVASPMPATMQEMTDIAAHLAAPVPAGTDPGKPLADEAAKWGAYWPIVYGKLYTNGDDTGTKTYGPGFYKAYRRIHLPDGDPNRITDPTVLYSQAGPGGNLTIAGIDKLRSEIAGRQTPEGTAESEMKRSFLDFAKKHISGEDLGFHGMKDPKGEQNFLKFQAYFFPAYEAGKREGKTPQQLLMPDSPSYLGKVLNTPGDGFVRDPTTWFNDIVSADSQAKPTSTPTATSAPQFKLNEVKDLGSLISAYKDHLVTKADADRYALDKGWIVPNPSAYPQVPRSQ